MNKKGDAGLVAIVIILIGLVFIGWLITINQRECNSDKDCQDGFYCSSDFSCHKIPVIERTVYKQSLTLPILFICITIIALAMIWKWNTIFKKNNGKIENKKETKIKPEKKSEPYYTSQFQYTAK
jgi:uncharacterized alpha/beta hydrolase family protein